MKVLLIGAGRMGMRHLQGLEGVASSCDVVDPRAEAREGARSTTGKMEVRTFANLDALPTDTQYDAAILASTAGGRRELFEAVESRGMPAILVEKPIAQNRADADALLDRVASSNSAVWVNHYRRTLSGFEPLRQAGGPFVLTVSSGAMGLGVNGVHWIDFAVHLTGASSGKLLYGEIEDTIIRSGRGSFLSRLWRAGDLRLPRWTTADAFVRGGKLGADHGVDRNSEGALDRRSA